MITVGNDVGFSLECCVSDKQSAEGSVYIVINKCRFGSKCDDFDLKRFFNNLKVSLESYQPLMPKLFELSAAEIFESIDAVRNDTSAEQCPIDMKVEGFFEDPSEVQSEIIFYGGDYAFDGITIISISNGLTTKLMIRDEEDLRFSEVELDLDEFRKFFLELESLVTRELK